MRKTRRQKGVSLIDTIITMGVLVVSLGGMAMMVLTTQNSSTAMRDRDMVRAQGVKYIERLMAIPYGGAGDGTATVDAVRELFDDNTVVTAGTGISLMSLRTPEDGPGWRFVLQGFEANGVFEIEVNSDLDGNGVGDGIRGVETPSLDGIAAGDGVSVVPLLSEGDPNLIRIEVFWNGQSLMKTIRSAPVEGS